MGFYFLYYLIAPKCKHTCPYRKEAEIRVTQKKDILPLQQHATLLAVKPIQIRNATLGAGKGQKTNSPLEPPEGL